jgi:hypothetical protein
MPYTQFSQSHSDLFIDGTDPSAQNNVHNASTVENQSTDVVDDILSRMDRLRTLASMQQKKARSNKRQQYSFCF